MGYIKEPVNKRGLNNQVAIIVINLGTPSELTAKSVRLYLSEFLGDPRVVEIPKVVWWFVLNVIILTFRVSKTLANYQSIWTDEGSPLAVYTRKQSQVLNDLLNQNSDDSVFFVVDYAMRYAHPSVSSVIERYRQEGIQKFLFVPMYPQYSSSTTGAVYDAIHSDFLKRRVVPDFRIIHHFYDEPSYIEALAASVTQKLQGRSFPDQLVFSFHGLPLRSIELGDPYHSQCLETAHKVVELLGLKKNQYSICFQSRFGYAQWLQPYTQSYVEDLAKKGIKSIAVICPSFMADCLETLEEIQGEVAHGFMEHGGEEFIYIPCLNDSLLFQNAFLPILKKHLACWSNS